jgi:S-DNA-T family DNA segregation ATPase FtsK/SpoIIIE
MTIIPFPRKQPEEPEEDPSDSLGLIMPGRSPKRDQPRSKPGTEVERYVVEAEIVDEDEGRPVPVDAPPVPATGPAWSQPTQWSPVRPTWWDARKDYAAYHRRRVTHAVKYHGLRSPVYVTRFAAQTPVGAARAIGGATRWVRAVDQVPLLEGSRGDPKSVVKAFEHHREAVQQRAAVLACVLVGALTLFFAARATGTPWDGWALLVAVLVVLGWVGRRRDKPIIGRAVEVQKAPKLTSDIVMRALASLGIGAINQAVAGKGSAISFPAPITRDGPGWRADVDLPHGVTAAEVMGKRDKLASGLRRPVGAVWPEPDHAVHGGRLVLWVGDQDMAKSKQAPWPLARSGTVDLFAPFPFATDQRGRNVLITLFETNVLIGALPGAGKTASVRLLTSAAALDPLAELWVFELAGKGDLSPAEKYAARYGSGLDDETIEQALWALKDARADIGRRAETMKGLPRGLCPDGKVTREVAERRHLKLHPLVLVLDEAQNVFGHPVHGKEAGTIAEEIIRMGRALGVILVLATQRPNKDAIPTGVSSLAGVRFCLRVMDQTSNDMILGTSMYQNGIRASTLRPTDRGIGYLIGASDEPQIARAFYLDLHAADRIAERARSLREKTGTLTGYAAGDVTPEHRGPDKSLLNDLLQVFSPDEDAVHSVELCKRLAEAWSQYEGWNERTLGAAAKAAGVRTKQVKIGGVNLFGIKREWILDGLEEPRAD